MRATYRAGITVILLVLLSTASFAATIKTRYRHSSYHHLRHVRWVPVMLKGSHESLVKQNAEINRLQLVRIQNDHDLEELIARDQLVGLPQSNFVRVDPRLEESRRYCRPWTRLFLEDFGQAYYKEFHQPLQVNSAVRTVEQQERLARYNHNAAPAEGETASSHLAGLTVDIAKRGMTRRQRAFAEKYLVNLRNLGLVEAVEERRQACFHVMVSDRYTSWRDSEKLAVAPGATRNSN
ncbi:MAG: DUF5715 family protein [Terriglobales bacterium]